MTRVGRRFIDYPDLAKIRNKETVDDFYNVVRVALPVVGPLFFFIYFRTDKLFDPVRDTYYFSTGFIICLYKIIH